MDKPKQTPEEKLQAAIDYLGKKYVFHRDQRVPKGNYETVLNRVDVAETVRRYREAQLEPMRRVWKLKER